MKKRTLIFWGIIIIAVAYIVFVFIFPENKRTVLFGGKWFWYNCAELDLLNHIVDLKARAIMKSEFIERIINYD